MEYAVWTLVLLMGAIWTHMSTPSWTQNPLDWEVFVRRAVDDSIITKCDFEDDSKPLCDWSQVSADDGDWIRASGPSPTGISGPPGGYPSGEGYYLHMDSRTFRTGGVARLRSPDIWEHGPLCLYFAYHMFGLSWGAQLRLLLLMGTQDNRPKVLWKHVNTQSPSWMPTTVSLPAELILPSRLIFEGMRGNTPFLDISLDALSIHRGTCNRVCMMKMCTFDVLNDLCGWSWIPTATGAKWVQKNGSSGKPGVGPEDDFSSPGHGFYMLLDPKNAKPGQKSVLLSPLSQSDGCLTLSFNYILWGHSLDAALLVYASLLGNIRKHTIFSGQPGPTWKPVSVNYTGQGQIQFTVVGIFGIIPEPSVAVDAISIAPCGESFPHCDFEDSAHPFCDWTHVFSDGGHWAWGSKNLPTIVGGSADSTYGGEHYIYFEADKFSRAGQSVRLGSRPFCAPGDICVEFAYHMNGLGKGSMLKFLLGSPAGSSPVTLWHRVGAQGPGWLNSSVTVPSGYQQPMQLFFEATRGSNSAFLVAVRFIKISHRICGEVTTTAAPTLAVSPTRPAVAPTSTMTPTGKPTVPMEKPVVLTEKPSFSIKKPTHSTEKPLASTEKPIPVEVATSPAVAVPATVELAISPAEASTSLAEAGPTPAEAAPTPAEAAPMPAETGPTPAEAVPAPEEAGPLPAEAGPSPVGAVPTPAEAATSLAGTATFPVEAGPTPAEASTSPAEAATSPAETATFPTEAATSPAETATFPTEAGTSPAETATSLAETEPTPAEAGTSPAEAATSPAEAVTSPVEAGPTPAEAGTSPALTATFSAEAGTTQAEAGTSPVEAAPAPAEAVPSPAEAVTSLVGAATSPVGAAPAPSGAAPGPAGISSTPSGAEPGPEGAEPGPAGAGAAPGPAGAGTVPGPEGSGAAPGPAGAGTVPGPAGAGAAPGPAGAGTVPGPEGSGAAPGPAGAGAAPGPEGAGAVPGPGGAGGAPGPAGAGAAPGPGGSGAAPGPEGVGAAPGPGGSGAGVAPGPGGAGAAPGPEGAGAAPGPGGSGAGVAPGPGGAGAAPGPGGSGAGVAPGPGGAGAAPGPEGAGAAPGPGGSGAGVAPGPGGAGAAPGPGGSGAGVAPGPEGAGAAPGPAGAGAAPGPEGSGAAPGPAGAGAAPGPAGAGAAPGPEGAAPGPAGAGAAPGPVGAGTAPGPEGAAPGPAGAGATPGPAGAGAAPGPAGAGAAPGPEGAAPGPAGISPGPGGAGATPGPGGAGAAPGPAGVGAMPGPVGISPGPAGVSSGPAGAGTVPGPAGAETAPGPAGVSPGPAGAGAVPGPEGSGATPGPEGSGAAPGPGGAGTAPATAKPAPAKVTMEAATFPAGPTMVTEAMFPGGSTPGAATFLVGATAEPAMFPASPTVVATNTFSVGSAPETATFPVSLTTETTTFPAGSTLVPAVSPTEAASVLVDFNEPVPTPVPAEVSAEATSIPLEILSEMTTTTGALIVPLETTTAMTMVLTETTAEMTMVLTEMTTQTTIFPTQAVTESTTVQFEVPMASVGATTEIATIPTENPAVLTEKPTIPILMPMIPTEKPTVPTERPVVPTEKPIGLTERPVVPIEKPTVPTEKPMVPTERPIVLTEKPVVPIERPTGPTEKPTVPIERPTAPIEKPVVPTEKPTVPTERSTVPTEKPTVPTERPTASTERSTAPTERPVVPTEKPMVPTERPTAPTKKSTLGIQSTMLASGTSWAPPTTRNATLTTVSCPPNAHYDFCMCPASCENPRPTCKLPCSPGCVCNQGFLLSQNNCISALSCHCFYGNRYYQPGENWLSSNCSERCHCSSGGQIDCQKAQCKTNMVCELRDNKYGCYPFGSATCVVYGALHYVTFDERHIGFTGRCTYILTQSCHNKTTEPFFRVMAENEKRGVEGVSCLSKVYMDLSTTSITLLKGRHILVEGERVTLPVMLPNNNRMSLSGRFVVLETSFGLTVRWDGDQQLFLTVTSTHSGHLCGLCGNYDGEGNNDNLKPNGGQAQNPEELGNSWQMARNESKECKKMNETAMVCDSEFVSTLSGPAFCGQLTLSNGIFEACLTNLKAASFFHNCVSDMCSYQGVQAMLCAHLSMITAICQSSGLPVQPWRGPSFCPLACPDNSKYSLCAKPCPETCLAKFTQKHCPHPCMEACECNPGFVLSGSQCIHRTQCGCLTPTGRYLKIGDVWYKPKCKELCICGSNHKFRCHSWNCTAQETCRWKDGSYGCHAIGEATCLASGDPHYLTFDGARHRFTGTCNYILSKPCWPGFLDNYFVVSATNENRGGNLEVAYIKAVHLVVFNLRISLLKGHKVTVEGHQVSLPVWLAQDRVTIRFSGNFILFYANFGLQVRYDGNHLVMVSVSSSYAGQLCGLCGNYNNNSLDDNLKPDRRPASNSSQLGASWRISEFSDPGCFVTGGGISDCKNSDTSTIWNKNCDILLNPMGPFSICHQVVAPQISFASCVRGQCESKGNALSLCNSLQAYADLCAQAGQAIAWRNSTFCPLKCLPNSSYKPCANPCPDACLSLSAPTYCPALPCVEGCECQKGYILSGRTCVPPSHCGCRDPEGFYHLVGETWYPEDTCHNLCSCWINNNITCVTTTCQANHMCSSQDGAFHCQAIGTGVCQVSEDVKYMSFDGVGQPIFGTCTHILVKVCDPSSKLPFFEINAKSESEGGGTKNFYIRRVYITVFSSHIILQNRHRVLIDGELVTLPVTKIHGVKITSSGDYTLVSVNNGVQVKYGGDHFLEIKVPAAYHKKLCGVCGNFNGQAEDDLMMPNNELIENGHDFMNSWRNHDLDPMCQSVEEEVTQVEVQETTNGKCQPADLGKIRQACQEALQTPAWAECATRVDIKPYILGCIDKLCEFGGLARGLIHTLCETLQGFETACRNEGLKTPIWRNSSFCPLECPEYSRYSNCLPSCSPSCQEPNCEGAGVRVPISCSEGCICQTDYVLNEGRCVPRSHCSCRNAQGASVPANKTWIAKGCNQRCTCTEGRIQCRSFQCPYGSHCQDGQSDNGYCIPDKSAQCTVLGDPYYRTFDGFGYHFPGRLTYILVKTVDTLPEGIESLLVEGRNKLDKASSPTLHEVIIMVYGYKVHLQTNLQLLVNGQRMDIPYVPSDELQVTLRGTRIFLITAFQLIVSYDGKDLAVINMPSTYQRLVRGLCGNYDKDKTNELTLPNGHVTQNIHVFISGWTVNPQDSLLRFPRALPEQEEGEKDAPAIRSQCSPEQLAFIHTSQACRVLVDPQGPFATCHQVMDPEPFEEHCVFDLCASQDPKEQEELRCRALSGYAIICQEAGASLVGWRNHTRCAMVCPANTVYSSCMIPCPASCANPAAASDCAGPCLEGCASLPGYIYSGTRSLPKAHCGCTAAGVYYQLGSSFVTEDCAQLCICASAGLLLCQPFGCRAGEICTLANFTRGCFQESPCLQNPCHNDGRCQEQGASFTCECDPGYGGRLCTEPRDSLSPQKPGPSSLTAILLGMLVPTLVVLPVLLVVATRECARRGLRPPGWREKPWSPDPGWLPD